MRTRDVLLLLGAALLLLAAVLSWVWGQVQRHRDLIVLCLLEALGESTPAQLVAHADGALHSRTIDDHVRRLVLVGLVRRRPHGLFCLTEAGARHISARVPAGLLRRQPGRDLYSLPGPQR